MKPADIILSAPIPLTGTFGRVEREAAAAMMLLGMRAANDWSPVTPADIVAAITEPSAAATWLNNPFVRPDIDDLIEHGFARWVGDELLGRRRPVEFTEAGIERLRQSRWNRARTAPTVMP